MHGLLSAGCQISSDSRKAGNPHRCRCCPAVVHVKVPVPRRAWILWGPRVVGHLPPFLRPLAEPLHASAGLWVQREKPADALQAKHGQSYRGARFQYQALLEAADRHISMKHANTHSVEKCRHQKHGEKPIDWVKEQMLFPGGPSLDALLAG